MMNACNNNVSFGAKLVSKQHIKKFVENSYKAEDELVSFVKINPKSFYDVKAIKDIYDRNKKLSFVDDIYCSIVDTIRKNPKEGDVFALTTQAKNFSKLDSEKILGLIEIAPDGANKGSIYIDYILKIPEHLKTITEEYSKVGTGMLNGLKEFYKNKKISLYSLDNAVEFYKRNGFKCVSKNSTEMEFVPSKK